MSVLLNFVECAFIVGGTSSIAYSRKLFACLCGRQLVNTAPSVLIVSPRNHEFACKTGTDVRVCSHDGKSPSRHSLCSGTCLICTIQR